MLQGTAGLEKIPLKFPENLWGDSGMLSLDQVPITLSEIPQKTSLFGVDVKLLSSS